MNKRVDFMYSTENNLDITLKQNKDGTYNLTDLKRYKQAESIKKQIKYFDDWGRVYLHHTAMRSGYVHRSKGCRIKKYNGRFGTGYTVDIPNFKNNRKHERRYYIFYKNDVKTYPSTLCETTDKNIPLITPAFLSEDEKNESTET